MNFTLRKWKTGDAASLRKNINDYEVYKNTLHVPYPYTGKNAEYWVNYNKKLVKLKASHESHFVIDIGGEVAGSVSILNIDRKNKKAEIGYWLGKNYRRRGIMTRAVKQVVKWGFEKGGLNRIYAYTFVFNTSSQRVLVKSGFAYEGRLKQNVIKEGKAYDNFIYAKVKK